MKYLVIIKADFNDADYIEETTFNLNEEDIKFIRKVGKIVMSYKNSGGKGYEWDYNWPEKDSWGVSPYEIYKGILTGNEIENFMGFLPYYEYGIHSIKSIKIVEYDSIETL